MPDAIVSKTRSHIVSGVISGFSCHFPLASRASRLAPCHTASSPCHAYACCYEESIAMIPPRRDRRATTLTVGPIGTLISPLTLFVLLIIQQGRQGPVGTVMAFDRRGNELAFPSVASPRPPPSRSRCAFSIRVPSRRCRSSTARRRFSPPAYPIVASGGTAAKVPGDGAAASGRIRLSSAKGIDDGVGDEDVIDAVVIRPMIEEGDETGDDDDGEEGEESLATPGALADAVTRKKRDVVKDAFRRLATLSLEDYRWRSSVFKQKEAERRVEESVARMMGDTPGYVRPMDAADDKIGPLGKAEKNAVEWLSKVFEEEAKRAQKIADGDGTVVRPIDMATGGEADARGGAAAEAAGPLADLERKAVTFLKLIAESETERASTGKLRPMELDDAKRGPLGEAEARLVTALEEVKKAERLRMEQSRRRGGTVVRPIDVPGPLGEIERAVLEIVSAEKRRAVEGTRGDGRIVRPMDASVAGPLGNVEREVSDACERLKEEERERLRNIKKALQEKRPMESDRDSPLGVTEAFTVGLLRAPKMIMTVVDRVKELIQSDSLSEEEKDIVRRKLPPSRADGDEEKQT